MCIIRKHIEMKESIFDLYKKLSTNKPNSVPTPIPTPIPSTQLPQPKIVSRPTIRIPGSIPSPVSIPSPTPMDWSRVLKKEKDFKDSREYKIMNNIIAQQTEELEELRKEIESIKEMLKNLKND
jgi:hypothetical protein